MLKKNLLLTLLTVLACFGVARAEYPASSVAYPYGGLKTSVTELNTIFIRQSSFSQVEIMKTADCSATFTNLETDEVVNASSVEIVVGDLGTPTYEVECHFPDLPSIGEWEFVLAAGSLQTADGDLSPEFSNTWTLNAPSLDVETITPVEMVPAAGSEIRAVGKDQGVWTVLFAPEIQEKIGFVGATLTDADPNHLYDGEPFYRYSYVIRNGNSSATGEPIEMDLSEPIVITWSGADSKMYQGYEYKLHLECRTTEYDGEIVGVYDCIFKGASASYQYAPETLLSVSPEPYKSDNDPGYLIDSEGDFTFTMTFSGAVECVESASGINMGMGSTAPYKSITPNADKTEWTFTVAGSRIDPPTLDVITAFTGSNGNRVAGNGAREELSCFQYQYKVTAGIPNLIANPASGSELESISEIVLTNDKNMKMSLGYQGIATIQNLQGQVLCELTGSAAADNKSITLTADPAFTYNGPVVVIVPAAYVTFGEEFSSQSSKAQTFSYQMVGEPTPPAGSLVPVSIDPENGSTVNELKEVVLTYDENLMVTPILDSSLPVYNLNREVVAYAFLEFDYYIMNQTFIHFAADQKNTEGFITLTEPGTYIINIPEGAIVEGEFGEGPSNEAFTLTYIIEGETPPAEYLKVTEIDPADGSTVASLSKVNIFFDQDNVAPVVYSLPLLNAEGETAAYAQLTYSFEAVNLIEITFTSDSNGNLPVEITEVGKYTLTIPEGTIVVEEKPETINSEIVLNWTVSTDVGVDGILNDGDLRGDVYTIQGVRVLRDADADAVRTLDKGIYVINGKKVVVK